MVGSAAALWLWAARPPRRQDKPLPQPWGAGQHRGKSTPGEQSPPAQRSWQPQPESTACRQIEGHGWFPRWKEGLGASKSLPSPYLRLLWTLDQPLLHGPSRTPPLSGGTPHIISHSNHYIGILSVTYSLYQTVLLFIKGQHCSAVLPAMGDRAHII